MFKDLLAALRAHPVLFLATALGVGLLAVGAGVVSPEIYSSTARVRLAIHPPPGTPRALVERAMRTECEVIRSEVVLGRTVAKLDWRRRWRPWQSSDRRRLDLRETMALLKADVEADPVPGTNWIAIRARSIDAHEAARLANAIAEAYQAHQQELLETDPSASTAIPAMLLSEAQPDDNPMRSARVRQLVGSTLGGVSLGFAAGLALSWAAFLVGQRPLRPDAFVPFFVITFLFLLGTSLPDHQANLAQATSGSVLLAFAVAALAHWLGELARRDDPVSPAVQCSIFALVFLGVFGTGALGEVLSAPVYRGTARLRLSWHPAAKLGTNAPQVAPDLPDARRVQTECQVMQSPVFLEKVAGELNLPVTWGMAYAGGERLRMEETILLFARHLEVRPVSNTSLIEVRAFSKSPDEAARIANAVAQTFRQQAKCVTPGGPQFHALRGEIVDGPASLPIPLRFPKQQALALGLWSGLFHACVAAAGGLWAARLIQRGRRWPAEILVLCAVTVVLALGVSAAWSLLQPERYSSTAQIRLESHPSLAASQIQAECDIIRSEATLGAVASKLSPRNAPERRRQGNPAVEVEQAVGRLRQRVDVRPFPGTSVIGIRVIGEDSMETAHTANTVAEVYCDSQRERRELTPWETNAIPAEIIGRAARPVRAMPSNNPLALALACLLGPLLSFLLGAATAWVASLVGSSRRARAALRLKAK